MRSALAVLLFLLASKVSAVPTWEDIRTLAYNNDVDAVENAMAEAHRLTQVGDMTHEQLRELQQGLLTTHPHLIDFTTQWMQEYPDSPYAKAVRAFQLNNAAWDIRGDDYVSKTHPEAMSAFYELREEGKRLALSAYYSARDYIPASDAVLMLEFGNRSMSDAELFGLVKRMMQVTPDVGTLSRALNFAQTNWGGDGIRMVREYCSNFASLITDIEGYSSDVCIADHTHSKNLQHDDYASFAYNVLEQTNHPELVHVRRNLALTRGNAEDIIYLLDWFAEDDNYNYAMAKKYIDKFPLDDRARTVFAEMDDRLQAMALEGLPHNPFSPRLIRILTREYPYYPQLRPLAERHPEHGNYLRRLAVSKPYDESTWQRIVYQNPDWRPLFSIKEEMPFIENAIYYSYYDQAVLSEMLYRMLDVHRTYENTKTAVEMAGPSEVHTQQPGVSTEYMEEYVYCPIYRIKRFQEAICEWTGQELTSCTPTGRSFREVIELIETRDICRAERFDAVEMLVYSPVPIDIDELNVEMASQ